MKLINILLNLPNIATNLCFSIGEEKEEKIAK